MFYLVDVALFALMVLWPLVNLWFLQPNTPELRQSEFVLIASGSILGGASAVIWLAGSTFGGRPSNVFLLIAPILVSVPALALARYFANLANFFDRFRRLRGLHLALVLYICLVCALTFVLTLAPPSLTDYDGLAYHLAAPRRYLMAGRIVELPDDHHSYFPFGVEMLFLLGLSWRGPVLAKLFHWLMLPLCCAALVAMGRRHFSTRAGLLAAALFASLPVVLAEASTAYVDLGLTAFALLAFLCFANWLQTRQSFWLLWVGVFCGFSLGAKYLGAMVFGWLGLWAVGRMFSTRSFALKPLFSFAALALLIGGGWYARNWWWTGNPVFPFAFEIFGGRGWTGEMARAYTVSQHEFGFGRGPMDWLMLPWRLAMTPLNALVSTPQGMALLPQGFWPVWPTSPPANNSGLFELGLWAQSIIGPPLLAFGAPLLFVRRKPVVVGFALWTFAFFWVFWAATGQYLRYLLPAFAILCLPCGWMIERCLQRGALLRNTTGVLLAAWAVFALALTLHNARPSWGVIAGQETPNAYLSRTFAPYDAMRWASTQTPPASRFALYGEPLGFYLERSYFWAADEHNNLIPYERVRTGADFVRELRAQGATHIFWNTRGGFVPPQAPLQDAVARGLLRRAFEAKGCVVFELAK